MNYKEAKNEEVFIIRNDRIVTTNLYDHVMESAEICCGPNGVTRRLYIKQTVSTTADNKECADCPHVAGLGCTAYDECELAKRWELRSYQTGGRSYQIDMFRSEDEAEQDMFDRIEATDFQQDVQRCTWYSYTRIACILEIMERTGRNLETTVSILKHQAQLDEARANIAAKRKELKERGAAIEQSVAEMYSTMIDPVDGESYKDTCGRLRAAIGEKISSRVFHLAVKMRRNY